MALDILDHAHQFRLETTDFNMIGLQEKPVRRNSGEAGKRGKLHQAGRLVILVFKMRIVEFVRHRRTAGKRYTHRPVRPAGERRNLRILRRTVFDHFRKALLGRTGEKSCQRHDCALTFLPLACPFSGSRRLC
ncbi:hypothetical protein D3C87_1628800 [compost metagenome]